MAFNLKRALSILDRAAYKAEELKVSMSFAIFNSKQLITVQ